MIVEQIYTGCLAEAACYIESHGEAAIIDPLRDIQPYIARAARSGARIRYLLETHFHADFVSGHVELAAKTGATIVFGPTAVPRYTAHIAKDGEDLPLGNVNIKVIHTPGHTMESTTYLLEDETGRHHAIFTGDTLFIGDVGRPDLVQKLHPGMTPECMAGLLFDSLRHKLMLLADDVIVYPGHGAGSACGKNMSRETMDTLGHQKQVNPALRADMTRGEFIAEVTRGEVTPPPYSAGNALLNIQGSMSALDEVLQHGSQPLTPSVFKQVWGRQEALVIDTRDKTVFPKAFLPGSVFIGLDDHFAPWVGALVPSPDQPVLLVVDKERITEAVIRLSRVGYDHSLGYLLGGTGAWEAAGYETDTLEEITAEAFASRYRVHPHLHLLDVCREHEYRARHIQGAVNFPLEQINQHMDQLDKHETWYLHCAGGYRSVVAASILKARGFHHIVNIQGGLTALSQTGLAIATSLPALPVL